MFDRIVCLNVDKRFSQRERLKREFDNVGLNIEFFLAGNGSLEEKYDHIDIDPDHGRTGYTYWVERPNSYNAFLCFKKIIRLAKQDGLNNVVLVEDDCTILPCFKDVFPLVVEELNSLQNWSMLYLCANHTYCKTMQLSPHILKVKGSGGFQFVMIKKNLFDPILNLKLNGPIDEQVAIHIHPVYNCYATWPNLAIPLPGYSYCEGHSYDNTKLYNNKGC